MLGIKFKDVILETIDQLRKRKARPDLDRISNMLQRKHGISFEDTEAILEKLVDSEVVFKVDYKGSTSYRNAAKWRISHIGGQVHNLNQSNQKIHALGQQPSINSTSSCDAMNVSGGVVSPGNRKNNSTTRSTHVNVVDTRELNSTSTTNSDSRVGKAASNYQYSENKVGNRGAKKANVTVTTITTIISTTSPPCYTSTLSTRHTGRNSRKELTSPKTTNTHVRGNTENWLCKENILMETLAFTATQNGNENKWDKKLHINENSHSSVVMTGTNKESDSNNKNNDENDDNNSNEKHTCALNAMIQTVHRRNMNNMLISTRTVNNYNGDSNKINDNNENGISSSSGVNGDDEDCSDDDSNTGYNKFKKAIGTSHCQNSAELVHDDLSKLTASLSSCVTVTTAGVTVASKSPPSIGSCEGRRENRLQSAVLGKPTIPCQNGREKQLQNNRVSLSTTNAHPRDNRMTKIATHVTPVLARRGRPVSKRKRIRKTPGPEFESEDILKFDQEKCVSCLLTADRNKHGQPEELLVCKDCNTTVHPSCMDYCEELATKARNSPWQCIECKTCFECDDSGDGDCMLFCDACDKGYHMKCHLPRVNEKPKGKWVCGQCTSESENSQAQPMEFDTATPEESSMPTTNGNHRDNVETSPPGLPTPQDSPAQPDPEEKPCVKEEPVSLPMLRDFQGPYPDAANWSIDDVVNFFKSAGFVTQAEAFREQEIDGKSLLLMKRSDVLTGLSLKLGPALKMYTHVQNLQLVGQSSYVNGTGH